MAGVCRIGDSVTGTCRAAVVGHPRTFTGTWSTGSSVVQANGIGVVRVGDTGITDCGHTIQATVGSSAMTADGLPVHRVGDAVIIVQGGSGVSSTGSPTVTG